MRLLLFFLLFSLGNSCINAQNVELKLSAIPFELEILNNPVSVLTPDDSILEIAAAGKTNLFVSPSGHYNVQNAPMVLFHPDTSFVLRAKVSGDLKEVYDVAALVVYQDSSYWGKFCYENSVDKRPTIVSVVNRIFSDDCNSMHIDKDHAFMAVVKKGLEMSFHYSPDGKSWEMIRNFRLETDKNLRVGFAVHGSRGNGFEAQFSQIKYSPNVPRNLRSLN